MTNQQHPITPPPELVWEWTSLANEEEGDEVWNSISTQAANWGADQELEACCEWLQDPELNVDIYKLRIARRPESPGLKEQALAALRQVGNCEEIDNATFDTIRRALEALPK